MDRPFYASRTTAQFVRSRFRYREDVAYSISSNTRSLKDERTRDHGSSSWKTRMSDKVCTSGGVQDYQVMYNVSLQHIEISGGQSQEGLEHLKLGATLRKWRTRPYNHYLRLSENVSVSEPSSRRRPQLELRHPMKYVPFNQVSITSPIYGFPSSRQCFGRNFTTSPASCADLENQQTIFNRDDEPPIQPYETEDKEPRIRERLRLWEAEYRAERRSDFDYEPLPSDIALAKHDQAVLFDEGTEYEFEDIPNPTFDRGDNMGLESQRPYLSRGDMVELRASNCFRIELAIFIRAIGSHYQYYTMSGKWIHQKPRLAKYCVPGFVDAEELDPLLAFLPSKAVPEALQHKLQDFEHALPRDVGSPLIKKMLDFWKESDKIYRDAALNLDNAHKIVAHKSRIRYGSLSDLAHKLLPKKYMKDCCFPAQALYALHRSLMLDELGFRPQKWNHRVMNQFEIMPISEIELIRTTGDDIRRYQEYLVDSVRGVKNIKHGSTASFLRFLMKVRHKINVSRSTREYTQHGMIGPTGHAVGGEANAETAKLPNNWKDKFDAFDLRCIHFITSWAALRTIKSDSYLHGLASTILRATGMYNDTILDQRVGWTFLQEVGAILPWENRTHFDMRLPSVMSGMMPPEERLDGINQLNTDHDVLGGLRKDWGSLPVYCIDDIDASEIDDGVSIEPADSADEFWIHVHVADPASMIEPRSIIAKKAKSVTTSVYLPDRTISMLPGDIVREYISLAPDRRCLTFSGRINLRGKLLDTKVTPGVLRNVLYMTPATLSAVVGETPLVNKRVITVGASTPKLPRKSPRQLIEAYEMTEMDKKNIKLLHTLGKSRQSLLSARGNLMFSSPSYEIKVTSNDDSVEHSENFPYIGKVSDPRIDLKVEPWSTDENRDHGNTVMNIMLLAGEVGARWCQERGIPIINRISQPHPDDPDPTKYFRRIILPLMNRSRETSSEPRNYDGEDSESDKSRVERTGSSQSQANDLMASSSFGAPKMVPLDVALEYQRLLGAVTPSTTPGPHLHIGLDMFTRNTSPLRRYSDLLVHWQIEAALLEEARSGHSLVGSTREDYLPFKKDELDRFLPLLHWRENELRGHDRAAQRIWAMQLILRAWKFNEAPLPATFELWAHTFDKETVTGYLTYFGGLSATFELRSWLLEEDLRAGDVFEVELADLDIYKKSLVVKPLRRLRRTAERAI